MRFFRSVLPIEHMESADSRGIHCYGVIDRYQKGTFAQNIGPIHESGGI